MPAQPKRRHRTARVGRGGRVLFVQGRRTWVRLHEKGGKRHEMPCHHSLDAYLTEYMDAADVADEPKGWLFRSTRARSGELTENPLSQADVYRMIRRRALAAGIRTQIGNHTFRATGITEYLRNGGKLEIAQRMANHESARTTGLYDRRDDQVSLDEVERILISLAGDTATSTSAGPVGSRSSATPRGSSSLRPDHKPAAMQQRIRYSQHEKYAFPTNGSFGETCPAHPLARRATPPHRGLSITCSRKAQPQGQPFQ